MAQAESGQWVFRHAPEGPDESWLHERIEVQKRADRQAPVTWTAMTSGFRTGDVRELESSLRMLCWKPATLLFDQDDHPRAKDQEVKGRVAKGHEHGELSERPGKESSPMKRWSLPTVSQPHGLRRSRPGKLSAKIGVGRGTPLCSCVSAGVQR